MSNLTQNNKSLLIELWRFILSLAIIVYHYINVHYSFNTRWYIFVEFFFMLSGLLLYKQINKYGYDYKNVLTIFLKKAKRIWPTYAVGLLSVIVSQSLFRDHLGISATIKKIYYAIPEFFFLSYGNNGAGWYINTMLIASFVLLFVLCINKKAAIYCVFPLGIAYIYWELYQANSSIVNWTSYTFSELIPDSQFRAFAGMMMGVLAGVVLEYLNKNITKKTQFVLKYGDLLGCVGMIFVGAAVFIVRDKLMEYLSIVLLFFSLIGIMGGQNINRLLYPCRNIISYLGVLSLSLYINQYTFNWISPRFSLPLSLLINIIANIIFAVVTSFIINNLFHIKKKETDKLSAG